MADKEIEIEVVVPVQDVFGAPGFQEVRLTLELLRPLLEEWDRERAGESQELRARVARLEEALRRIVVTEAEGRACSWLGTAADMARVARRALEGPG